MVDTSIIDYFIIWIYLNGDWLLYFINIAQEGYFHLVTYLGFIFPSESWYHYCSITGLFIMGIEQYSVNIKSDKMR